MIKIRPTTTLTTASKTRIQPWYRGRMHYRSWSTDWYTRHEQYYHRQRHILCYKAWATFHPLSHPSYDSNCSYYINTKIYSEILHSWLPHNIIAVADIVGILFLSSLRCIFLLHMQPILPLILCTTIKHDICHSISKWWWNITMKRCIYTLS